MRTKRPISERFWEKVQKTEDCWMWTGARDPKGYGRIGREDRWDRSALAHRISWELHNGPIPEGREVCHQCDNPPCVRPDHLYVGSHADNMTDMAERGHRKGEGHEGHRLTEEQVREIRQVETIGKGRWRRKSGTTYEELARRYGVSEATIRDAVKRRTWKHLE